MKQYWVWLSLALGPACPIVHEVLEDYGSIEEVYQNRGAIPEKFPMFFNEKRRARWEKADLSYARRILDDCRYNGYEVITVEDPLYPPLLFEIKDCPLVLYAQGNTKLLESMMTLGVVGTRSMTVDGCNNTLKICIPLSKCGIVLVSGFNIGGDEFAHKSALAGAGGSIAVLANGLDVPPRMAMRPMAKLLQKNGVFLTEFPPGTEVQKSSYHIRNRIISGMSMGLLVTQAPEHSGVMITANAAVEQGRDVFAIPAAPDDRTSAGNIRLIREGAYPVTRAEDIIMQLWPQLSQRALDSIDRPEEPFRKYEEAPPMAAQSSEVSPEAPRGNSLSQVVLQALEQGDLTADELADLTHYPIHKIQATVSILEIQGDIRPLPGKRFALVKNS